MLDVPGAGSGSLSSNSGLGHVGQVSSPAPSAASASGMRSSPPFPPLVWLKGVCYFCATFGYFLLFWGRRPHHQFVFFFCGESDKSFVPMKIRIHIVHNYPHLLSHHTPPPPPGAPRILTFNPRKLCFPPPLDRVIENRIILHNPSPTCVAWKFLSATPRRYFVTPIVGFLV